MNKLYQWLDANEVAKLLFMIVLGSMPGTIMAFVPYPAKLPVFLIFISMIVALVLHRLRYLKLKRR